MVFAIANAANSAQAPFVPPALKNDNDEAKKGLRQSTDLTSYLVTGENLISFGFGNTVGKHGATCKFLVDGTPYDLINVSGNGVGVFATKAIRVILAD